MYGCYGQECFFGKAGSELCSDAFPDGFYSYRVTVPLAIWPSVARASYTSTTATKAASDGISSCFKPLGYPCSLYHFCICRLNNEGFTLDPFLFRRLILLQLLLYKFLKGLVARIGLFVFMTEVKGVATATAVTKTIEVVF